MFATRMLPCTAVADWVAADCALSRRCLGLLALVRLTIGWFMQTSEAERIGVNQVAKILPSGKSSGSDQRAPAASRV